MKGLKKFIFFFSNEQWRRLPISARKIQELLLPNAAMKIMKCTLSYSAKIDNGNSYELLLPVLARINTILN